MTDTLTRIAAVLREQLVLAEDHPITPDTRLVADLGCDILDMAEAILNVEDEFGLEFTDAETERLLTVGDIAALVEAKKQVAA